MKWMREHGIISTLDDYEHLPLGVVQDARLLMESEAQAYEMQVRKHG